MLVFEMIRLNEILYEIEKENSSTFILNTINDITSFNEEDTKFNKGNTIKVNDIIEENVNNEVFTKLF